MKSDNDDVKADSGDDNDDITPQITSNIVPIHYSKASVQEYKLKLISLQVFFIKFLFFFFNIIHVLLYFYRHHFMKYYYNVTGPNFFINF